MRVDLTYFAPSGERLGSGFYYSPQQDPQAIYNEVAGLRADGDLPQQGVVAPTIRSRPDVHVLISTPTLPRSKTFLLTWNGAAQNGK